MQLLSLATEEKCPPTLSPTSDLVWIHEVGCKGRIEMRDDESGPQTDFSFQSCTISHETLEDGPQRIHGPISSATGCEAPELGHVCRFQSVPKKNICLVALFFFFLPHTWHLKGASLSDPANTHEVAEYMWGY